MCVHTHTHTHTHTYNIDPIIKVLRECPGPNSITATHKDSKDGSFDVSYTITATGNYSVHVKLRGSTDHIGGSPFLSLVVANAIGLF